MPLQYDRELRMPFAGGRQAKHWPVSIIWWSELVEKLAVPVRGAETMEAYLRLPKAKQDELKDVGGFVAGTLRDNRRKAANILSRDVVTLDLDNIPPGGRDDALRRLESLGCGYAAYSTRKHRPDAPRLRVLLPLSRAVSADEYEPLARKLAEYLGLEWCDPTTFEASRLMYWPSCCADGEYVYVYGDRPFADPGGVLALYADWRDISAWPQVPGHDDAPRRLAQRQGNPLEKSGVVGAFCRVYDIPAAMEAFLSGIYEPTDKEDRYTFVGGSTTGGAVLYDGGAFLFSHHATDPCGGRLVNAFDLIRLHRFGELDDEAPEKAFGRMLPSYKAMCQLAADDPAVRSNVAAEEFGDVEQSVTGADTRPWTDRLTYDSNMALHKTLSNITLLVRNIPELNGCARRDDFSGRMLAADGLPWRTEPGYWSDADTTELRRYFETAHRGFRPSKQDVGDTIEAVATAQRFHPVRDYLNGLTWDGQPRLDTLFADYLGVEDSDYSRAVTRKAMTGAVARVMDPGCKFDYMTVFVGKQGRGKSSIMYILAGGPEWFSDSLVTFDGQKAFEAVLGKWLVEIPEMHAFDRVTMNQAKAFITKQSDYFRAAFARFPEDKRRQCVFFGTTNNRDCLRDDTGGRRFWPLDTDKTKRKKRLFTDLPSERDQVWAEAVVCWRQQEPLFLSEEMEAIAAGVQEDHREVHPWEDTIRNFVVQDVPEDWDSWDLSRRMVFWSGHVTGDITLVSRSKICVREIWQEALGNQLSMLDQQKARAITGVLNRIPGWERGGTMHTGRAYGRQKVFRRTVTE